MIFGEIDKISLKLGGYAHISPKCKLSLENPKFDGSFSNWSNTYYLSNW